jgi:hypothetical protein
MCKILRVLVTCALSLVVVAVPAAPGVTLGVAGAYSGVITCSVP